MSGLSSGQVAGAQAEAERVGAKIVSISIIRDPQSGLRAVVAAAAGLAIRLHQREFPEAHVQMFKALAELR